MSKKYDEYFGDKYQAKYLLDFLYTKRDSEEIDKDLLREIRDKAIISVVTSLIQSNLPFNYGDILFLVDGDKSERLYEEENGVQRKRVNIKR